MTAQNDERAIRGVLHADARADGGRRRVTIEARRILIERSVRGVAMRIGVPAKAYAGVVLAIDAAPGGARLYRVALVHADADLAIPLYEGGEDAARQAWASFARFLDLPRFVARHDGCLDPVAEPLRVESGPSVSPRCRGSLTRGRRGRFARRRAPGGNQAGLARFDTETEIISYE
jgi:hypothetical protein